MMIRLIPLTLPPLLALAPAAVLAHVGDHSTVPPDHYLTSLWHVPGLLLLAVALGGLAWRTAIRNRDDRHDPR